MTKEQKNELAVTTGFDVSNEFAGQFNTDLGMGAGENIDADDIVIPKIHLAQALTPEAQDAQNEVKVGSYMHSVDKTLIGDTMDMFVIGKVKLWQFYYEVKQGKKVTKEYLGTIEHNRDNKDLKDLCYIPAELKEKAAENGVTEAMLLKPDRILRFSVLLLEEVLHGLAFPYFVDFKRSSYPAGTKLETTFAKMRSVNLPSYAKVFNLKSKFISNDFDYYVKEVSVGRNIEKEELQAVEHWVSELASNADKYAADESDTQEETFNKDETIDVESVEVNTNQKF
jgi:hypothetical protein